MNVYADERGKIIDVGEGEYKAIQMIFSNKGSVRSNHYHKRGGHLLYVVSGRMRYLERPVEGGEVSERVIERGGSVFTGPMLVHATEFLEDTVLVCAATLSREGDGYGDDTVREVIL